MRFFTERGYSWGAKDKLFLAHGPRIKVVRFRPKSRRTPFGFNDIDEIQLGSWKGDVV